MQIFFNQYNFNCTFRFVINVQLIARSWRPSASKGAASDRIWATTGHNPKSYAGAGARAPAGGSGPWRHARTCGPCPTTHIEVIGRILEPETEARCIGRCTPRNGVRVQSGRKKARAHVCNDGVGDRGPQQRNESNAEFEKDKAREGRGERLVHRTLSKSSDLYSKNVKKRMLFESLRNMRFSALCKVHVWTFLTPSLNSAPFWGSYRFSHCLTKYNPSTLPNCISSCSVFNGILYNVHIWV